MERLTSFNRLLNSTVFCLNSSLSSNCPWRLASSCSMSFASRKIKLDPFSKGSSSSVIFNLGWSILIYKLRNIRMHRNGWLLERPFELLVDLFLPNSVQCAADKIFLQEPLLHFCPRHQSLLSSSLCRFERADCQGIPTQYLNIRERISN